MITDPHKKMDTEYIVQVSAARMPQSCWGRYVRIAVMEVQLGCRPAMISERAKGVIRVVETWEKMFIGKTDRCAARVAQAEAEAMAQRLNEQEIA